MSDRAQSCDRTVALFLSSLSDRLRSNPLSAFSWSHTGRGMCVQQQETVAFQVCGRCAEHQMVKERTDLDLTVLILAYPRIKTAQMTCVYTTPPEWIRVRDF